MSGKSLRQISPSILSNLIGETVERLSSELIGEFSSELWRLHLVLADGAEKQVVLKRPKREGESTIAERVFYQRFGNSLSSSPRFLGYLESEDGILLEQVPGLTIFDWRRGPTVQHAKDSLAALAELHRVVPSGATGAHAEISLDWLPACTAGYSERLAAEFDSAWPARREMLTAYCPEATPLGDNLVGRLGPTLASLQTPSCLLHGDAHGENLPAREGGGVCMLDWEDAMLGNPGIDVADYLLMSYQIVDRRRQQESLINYHAALLNRDDYDPLLGFRLGALRKLVRTVCEAHAHPDWSRTSLPWVFKRCATGALDADVTELVR